jgi:hypothetical protein
MRAEGIGQENRFAAIGTYGNDFPFIGLKSPNNTNRAVYQLNQPTDNRSITSNLDSGSKQHSGQEIMKIRLADLIRVAIDFQQTVCRGPPRPVRRKQGSRIDVICIDSPVSIFGINLHSVQHIHLQLSPAERTVGDRFGFLSPDCHIYLDEMFKAGAAILAGTVDDIDLIGSRASVR